MKTNLKFRKNYSTDLVRMLSLFGRVEKFKLSILVIMQVTLALLDLVGVMLIGVIGSLTVTGVQSKDPGERVSRVLEFFSLESLRVQNQVSILGLLAATILIARTICSVVVTRKSLVFLSNRTAVVSSLLLRKALDTNINKLRSRTSQEFLFSITSGVSVVMLGMVASIIGLIGDFALLAIMAVGLFLVDKITGLLTIVIFGSLAVLLYKLFQNKAYNLGAADTQEQIFSNTKILEVFHAYKEYTVRNRKYQAFTQISESRFRIAKINSEKAFMPFISKYVFEVFLVLTTCLVSMFQFATQDASRAIGSLSIFLAAGARIAPGILRIQQNFIALKGSLAPANITLDAIQELSDFDVIEEDNREIQYRHGGFEGTVEVVDVCFLFDENSNFNMKNINFDLKPGEIVAIVGESGSGKSTLADLMLGIFVPTSGKILISNKMPQDAIKTWPGAIGYVPQDVYIMKGTIKENICLGYESNSVGDLLVWRSLKQANLDEFVRELPKGLATRIGDGGQSLSGGQKQRLGIARALLTNPKLLIFDEATSALDSKTEKEINNTIKKLSKQAGIVLIAHRESSIRIASKVIRLSKGRMVGKK